MQVVREETEPFEMWYQEHFGLEKSNTQTPSFTENKNQDPINELSKEISDSPLMIESSIVKYEQMNNSKISTITESMVNKAQENISKYEQMNDDKLSMITKSMINKTEERLTKFEEIDNMRYLLALKHHDRIIQIKHEYAA